jgi:osmotically-inducible protein OsmY
MAWLERIFQEELPPETAKQATEGHMSPGPDGGYDRERREKASMRQPPPPPEHMGLEGEYDPQGLAKRVAEAFDRNPEIDDIETLNITQKGSTVIFEGAIPSQDMLSRMVDVARGVDGAKAVETDLVEIGTA